MPGLLLRWIISAVALYLTDQLVPGIALHGVGSLLAAAAMIGIINAVVRPVVLFLTLPLSILTLGLFALIVNAAMLGLAAAVVPGFEVNGFWAALFGWLLLSFFTFCINVLIGEHGRIEVVTFRY